MSTIEKGKYTAGPWSYDTETDRITGLRTSFGIEYIENVAKPMQPLHDETREANVRLIAAAPELLETLKLVPLPKCNSQRLGNYDDYPSACDCGNCELRWQIEAAIAKAEGQP